MCFPNLSTGDTRGYNDNKFKFPALFLSLCYSALTQRRVMKNETCLTEIGQRVHFRTQVVQIHTFYLNIVRKMANSSNNAGSFIRPKKMLGM